jgi:hypothetical protein
MKKPPSKIDEAKVLHWAWAGKKPFGIIYHSDDSLSAQVFGLAICQYENSDIIYRFSCDENWESVQDSDYNSVEEAKVHLPEQYKNVPINWIEFETNQL